MAHFADVDDTNTVVRVLVVPDEHEHRGHEYLTVDMNLGGRWIQTSYTNRIRYNYASVGYTYDPVRDAFIPPKPYPSWKLNETTCSWEAPVLLSDTERYYEWNETTQQWLLPGEQPSSSLWKRMVQSVRAFVGI